MWPLGRDALLRVQAARKRGPPQPFARTRRGRVPTRICHISALFSAFPVGTFPRNVRLSESPGMGAKKGKWTQEHRILSNISIISTKQKLLSAKKEAGGCGDGALAVERRRDGVATAGGRPKKSGREVGACGRARLRPRRNPARGRRGRAARAPSGGKEAGGGQGEPLARNQRKDTRYYRIFRNFRNFRQNRNCSLAEGRRENGGREVFAGRGAGGRGELRRRNGRTDAAGAATGKDRPGHAKGTTIHLRLFDFDISHLA